MFPPLSKLLRPPTLLLAATLLAAWSPAPARADSAAERFSKRHRVLDTAENTRALDAARGPAESELRRRAGRAAGSPERLEVLEVDVHRYAKDVRAEEYRRRADVYIYDYDSDALAVAVVDLETNHVDAVTVTPGVQRPLNDREVARALDLLLADATSGARIRAEFQRITGRPLRNPSELTVSGFVYRADAMPDSNTTDTAACGRHRCAQLLISTQDAFSIELPIVDLSKQRVLQGRWLGAPPVGNAPAGDEPKADAQ
jgi:hypothetical protein